jgi:hypothetical protein
MAWAEPTLVGVDSGAEVREFLVSRRAKITPRQAGLPEVGNRRVPGLRRGEVTIYAAEPGSSTEHALALLASWAAAEDAEATEEAARPT